MKEELKRLENNALIELSKAKNKDEVDKIRVKYLGRRIGLITLLSKKVSKIPIEERSGIGTLLRNARKKVEEEIGKSVPEQEQVGTKKNIDTTTPGRKFESGNLHPITLVIEEVKEIFHYLGFSWAEGPEVESDLYNFQKLNIPRDHPARDVQQTYYISSDLLLRTHTSNMQVRYMIENKPPVRVLFPGRVFRREMPDATHYPAFFQIEGLMVGRNVRMTSLLGTLDYFVKRFFGANSKIRVYGHHFPYTEPSVEIEVYHPKKGWLEILGAGMVHPNVLKEGGIDPEEFTGWAFGVGADRLVMLKYDIEDIRILFDNDLNFLRQF